MQNFIIIGISFLALSTATPAEAYIGLGPAITMIGSFFSLLIGVGIVLLIVLVLPLRMALKRRKKKREENTPPNENNLNT